MAKSIVVVSYALLGVTIHREIEMNFILNELSIRSLTSRP